MLENLILAQDKYEAAIAMQPEAAIQRTTQTLRHVVKPKVVPSVPPTATFDPKTVPKSTTLHLDYTGRMPSRGSNGTLYFLFACWGSYIHLEPLTNLKGPDTALAIRNAVNFFRNKHVEIDTLRMDNQTSPEVRAMASELDLQWDLVNPYQKEPNRAERAIRTGKNHIIAV
jgi:hypothetical protein